MLLNVGLLALALLAAYRLYLRWGTRSGPGGAARQNQAAALPRMKRRDFSLEQLREFDGTRNPRILLAVNGKVFDVTKGSKFYGPGETPARRGLGGPSAAASLPPTLPPCRARAPRLLRAARRVSGGEGEAAPGRTAGMCRGGRALPRRPGLCAGGAPAAPPPRGRWVSERPRGVPPLVAPLGLWVCLGRATPRFPAARDASRGRQLPAGCQGSPACEPRPVAAARGPAERPPGTVLQFQTGDAKRVSGLFGLPSHIQFSGCLDLDVQRLIVFFSLSFLVGLPSATEQWFLHSNSYGSGKKTKKPKQKENNRTTTDYLFKGANDILGMNFSQDRGKQGEPEDWSVATIENSAEINTNTENRVLWSRNVYFRGSEKYASKAVLCLCFLIVGCEAAAYFLLINSVLNNELDKLTSEHCVQIRCQRKWRLWLLIIFFLKQWWFGKLDQIMQEFL